MDSLTRDVWWVWVLDASTELLVHVNRNIWRFICAPGYCQTRSLCQCQWDVLVCGSQRGRDLLTLIPPIICFANTAWLLLFKDFIEQRHYILLSWLQISKSTFVVTYSSSLKMCLVFIGKLFLSVPCLCLSRFSRSQQCVEDASFLTYFCILELITLSYGCQLVGSISHHLLHAAESLLRSR